MYPVKNKSSVKPDENKFAELLKEVYSTSTPFEYAPSCNVPAFTKVELTSALRSMCKKKSADKSGVFCEMFKYANEGVLQCLLGFLNDIVSTGHIPSEWYDTHFGLLHKGGKADDPNNWRPIANLQMTYRVLARLVYNRIRAGLDQKQSEDQFGFRRNRSCLHALLVMESMIAECIEFNTPVWIVT